MSQPPYPGQPYDGQPSSGQPYQGGQQPASGQPYSGQPYSGQPYQGQPYGQPNPDVPSSVPPQPGYPPTQAYPSGDYGQQQSYGQQPPPSYGQPDYGQQQPGFPPPGAPTPPKKNKVLPIVLISVAIVLVLCIGGITAVVMLVRNDDKDPVNNSATQQPTPDPTVTTTAPADPDPTTEAPTATIQIVEPRTLGGRPKLTDAQFASVAKQLQDSLKGLPGATASVGALYGEVEKQNIVIVAAAEAPLDDPAKELDNTFYGAGIGGMKITNITPASTGSLGGSAKCGASKTSGIDLAICAWADEGSLGMFIWFAKSVSKAKAEFPTLRAQVEKKS